MDIVVCIKRVVDTETRVKIDGTGAGIDLGGVQFIMAPYDEMAVEKAIQLRDAAGSGSVTVLTIGGAAATKELRTALAMGADRALHVVHEGALDALATAKTLRAALDGRKADIVLLGKQATDDDDAAVGPMLAELLGLPCVAFVSELEVADGVATARREVAGAAECVQVALPALFTAQKGLAEARYPGLKGIMAAKKKPLETLELSPAASPSTVKALALPPPRGEMQSIEASADGMTTLLGALRADKKVI